MAPFLVCGAFPGVHPGIESVLGTTELGTALLFGACSLAVYLVVIAPSSRTADRFSMAVLGLAPAVATSISGLGPDAFASRGLPGTPGEEAAFWHNAGSAVLLGWLAWALLRQTGTHTEAYHPVRQA